MHNYSVHKFLSTVFLLVEYSFRTLQSTSFTVSCYSLHKRRFTKSNLTQMLESYYYGLDVGHKVVFLQSFIFLIFELLIKGLPID